MTDKTVAIVEHGDLKVAHEEPTQLGRFKAFTEALSAVADPRCKRPIPRFMLAMPWAEDDESIQEQIIAQILASDDPYAAAEDPLTTSGKDLVGQKVTVYDVRCRPSDKPGGWGAYLICDTTIGDSDVHQMVTVGAKQAVAMLAYAHFNGDLPITGTFTVVTETGAGNTVIGFIVETAL